jgi:hypothetical protein
LREEISGKDHARSVDPMSGVRALAVYLPQFHPIPENDQWWGKGFTEWSNVAGSLPLFRGHQQPVIPADLGFCDLRLAETRQAQADLARSHGIHGFCYYHYWFHGRRLLERPFNEVLESGQPEYPFCLCWANESWSRRWLGEDQEILIRQTYSTDDHRAHARWLSRAFSDPRYVRVAGHPLFLIYRPLDIPDLARAMDEFRREVERQGVACPWLVGVDAHCPGTDFRVHGLDASMRFEPQLGVNPGFMSDRFSLARLARNLRMGVMSGMLRLYDDAQSRERMRNQAATYGHSAYPCVYVGWDNSPRRGRNGIIFMNRRSEEFARSLHHALSHARTFPEHERLVFINAWNEWAEGNHLEPDTVRGHAMLECVSGCLRGAAPAAETDASPMRLRTPH